MFESLHPTSEVGSGERRQQRIDKAVLASVLQHAPLLRELTVEVAVQCDELRPLAALRRLRRLAVGKAERLWAVHEGEQVIPARFLITNDALPVECELDLFDNVHMDGRAAFFAWLEAGGERV